jgi:UDP-glucose 4-epimerase
LVTGGAGFVGSVCCSQLLQQGHSVAVIDDLSTGHEAAVPAGAAFYRMDFGDQAAVGQLLRSHRFDAVFHFAAKALIPESVTNPGVFFETNVKSGISFLEALRSQGVARFVFSSSAAVYGSPSSIPIDEESPKCPVNSYGETKLMFERILHWYAIAYGWTVLAFRYFNACGATSVLGEDHQPETHIIPLLLQAAAGERPYFSIYGTDYPTPDGTCLRDYVHVSDIAAAHLLALESPEDHGLTSYNIGTGTSHSVLEVARIVEEVTGKQIDLRNAPRRAGDPAVLCANPAHLMRNLGWKSRHSDLKDIVASAWRWRQKNRDGYRTQAPAVSMP